MSACGNCGANITCGCQKRTLPNGKTGCTKCAGPSAPKVTKTTSLKPSLTNTVPQNKVVWGPDRYRNLNKFK